MRFISKTPQYRITAIKPKQRVVALPSGLSDTITEDPGHICQFRPHGLTSWEMDIARERWAGDYANKIPRGGRIENKFGVFDTQMEQETYRDREGNRLSDERRELIEQALMTKDGYGTRFIKVDRPRIRAPWASYDEIVTAQGVTNAKVASQIVEIMKATGTDVDLVIAYERENLNRESVINAILEEAKSADARAPEVQVPA